MVAKKTSWDRGHRHAWDSRAAFTSKDNGHDHPINLKRKIALKGTTKHTHRLLNELE